MTYYNSVIPPTFRARAKGVATVGNADVGTSTRGADVADATTAATNAGDDSGACDVAVVDVDLMPTAN